MKHILMLATVFFLSSAALLGQPGEELESKIQQARKDYFEEELQLTASESEAFWPIYKEMKREQEDLKVEYESRRKIELMSDTEVEAYIVRSFELEQKQLELKKRYFEKFKKIMSIRKIATLKRTEQRFKRELLKRMRSNRRQKMRNRQ